MKKLISSLLLLLTVCGFAVAQDAPQLTPLPVMPGVRTGVLPNGLTYYVKHNEEPKNRANFYIAQKVGSTLETPDQLGLAHFLEHMAFNGTKNYPGKNLLNYLQAKGIRFGEDINAYTSFDETVYNIDNVPCSDKALMDSVLLALRDWSCNILLEETEINAERGVIQEEWRSRNDANTRMFTNILPELYEEYQYEQMPIGKMEVVMNFKPQALRDYYHKWYRPDQQGIIIVGDFDAEEMEKKVIEMFSSIPMPENAAERVYPNVSDNIDPIYVTFEDPELQFGLIMVNFKFDPTPFEYRNTVEMYLQDHLLTSVLATLLNNRLAEYAEKPECNYIQAGVNFGTYYVSKTKEAINIQIISKGDAKAAFEDAMSIIARACKTGFTDSELERVDSQIISNYEALYNERDKTKTSSIAQELIRLFVDNEPAPGIETEYQLVSGVLPNIPVQAVNAAASQLLTPHNEVIVVAQPKSPAYTLPERETMTAALHSILDAQYEAYVDEVITDPLIAKLPTPGSIKSESEKPEFGTTEFILSNGVKVVVKPTDYASDEILINMFSESGKKYYPASQACNILAIEDAYDSCNFGPFDTNQLRKYLSGKKVSLGLTMGISTLVFEGQSTVKDFPTLMELLYTSFAGLTPNQAQFDLNMEKARKMLELQANNPNVLFSNARVDAEFGNNPAMTNPTPEIIDCISYPETIKLLKEATSNAANFTLVITGNVEISSLRPFLEQYVASLPSKGKVDRKKVLNNIGIATGQIQKTVEAAMETPAVVVYDDYSGDNLNYDMKNQVMLSLFSSVLDNQFIRTLREEEGGTYGAAVNADMLPSSHQWRLVYYFQTNHDMAQRLIDRAHKETLELMADGADAVEFGKVKEAAIKQHEIALRDNGYWLAQLVSIERGYNLLSGYQKYLESITLDDFNSYISGIYDGKNRIQVILDGKAK